MAISTPIESEIYDGFDKLLIGGGWRHGAAARPNVDINPYTGETLVEIPMVSRGDVDDAYATAKRAQVEWARRTPAERSAVMTRAAEIFEHRHAEIVNWLIRESGSTRLKAEMEWGFTRDVTAEASRMPYQLRGSLSESDVPGKENRVYRQPLGVVLVISPWNFPLVLTQRSLAPALALGNAVVLKPASNTPVTGGLLFAKIFEEAGLPAGAMSVIVGSGSEIGDYIVQHDTSALVSFTGSTPVGQRVGSLAMAAPRLKRVALVLGGNAPVVVLGDADVEQAVDAAAFGRFLHQGQICMSTNRVIVDDAIYAEFVDAFVQKVRGLKAGDPDQADTLIGPIIDKQQFDSVIEKIVHARRDGARELVGGEPQGQVIPAHVFADVTPQMEIANVEIFGPVVPVLRVHGDDEALALANNTEFGLSSAVFTRDLERGVNFAKRVEAGMTHVNDITVEDEANAPFGGEKNSGLGRFHSEYIVEEFTKPHWISVQHTRRRYPLL
jgi:aldehyde dehydrogenase (NAD+)